MKTILLALAASTALAMPVFAAEGNGEPFPLRTPGVTTSVSQQQRADVGSSAYPNVVGRPGSALTQLAGDIVPDTGNEAPVQTANSLPRGFTQGLPVYARLEPAKPTQFASVNRSRN